MKEKLLIILGPTACGKSALAVELAKKFNGEIISGDSMQVYRGLNIGTAKITLKEAQGVPHHLIDILDPDQAYTVADFQNAARELISDISARGRLPIIAGGTGLYLFSLISPYLFTEETAAVHEVRKRLRARLQEEGAEFMHGLLQAVDPEAAEKIHYNDHQRLLRALEVYLLSGEPISQLQKKSRQKFECSYNLQMVGLTMERSLLYQRIEQRVDKMLANGLVEEVKGLLDKGFSPDLNCMKGLGYEQIVGYLQSKYDLNEAVRLLKRDTRHFAKRQFTWFKRDQRIKWFDVGDYADRQQLTESVTEYLLNSCFL